MSTPDPYIKYNQIIRTWNWPIPGYLKNQMRKLEVRSYSGDLYSALDFKYYQKFGQIFRIRYKMPKQGVWIHKGVGRGTPISQAGTATTKRVVKDWFNTPINTPLNRLSGQLAQEGAELIINNVGIR